MRCRSPSATACFYLWLAVEQYRYIQSREWEKTVFSQPLRKNDENNNQQETRKFTRERYENDRKGTRREGRRGAQQQQ